MLLPMMRERLLCALPLLCLTTPALAAAEDAAVDASPEIVVTAARRAAADTPASSASIDAARIAATVNAVNAEDVLKYLPSLLVRKRHIGDTQAPLATRTSGVGASARSLIYADGALLSALIGNNNSNASPRWSMVSPEEIARVDVLYGPFSAAYPGNSIGAVVNFTTRLPDRFEATLTALGSWQDFDQYGTHLTAPASQIGATIGDRVGPLSLFASLVHTRSRSQPLTYATIARPTSALAAGTPATGAFADLNRTGQAIFVLGAGGLERQRQTNAKLKAALALGPSTRLTYVGGLFVNDTDSHAETYLRDAAGAPLYAGSVNIAGSAVSIPASSLSNGVYRFDERHWSHSLSAEGNGGPFDWQLIGTLYDYAKDVQRAPSTALPAAASGGAGSIVRMDGTGWKTLDGRLRWTAAGHRLSLGAHGDWVKLVNERYATTDWIGGAPGALTVASRGRTRTAALWAEDAWRLADALTLTVGGRQEWWQASKGYNFSASPALSVAQPGLTAARFSPKASLAWVVQPGWAASASFGLAYRFPTVSELYQAVTTGNSLTVPNPNLRPERALSAELALERAGGWGHVRLALFNERINQALLSQSAPLVPGSAVLYSYVQNVDRVRTRGAELSWDVRALLPGVDLAGSVTLVDPRITADAAFPIAIGKRPPQVPTRKATLVATWRPTAPLSLSGAIRYSSRSFATIDNSDPVANTYQGFASYVVADLRATVALGQHLTLAGGVDNVGDRRYFLFHPFPARTWTAEMRYRF